MVLGFNLTFFPQFIAGWAGMPRRVADYPATGLLESVNMASTVGGFVLTVAVIIFIVNVVLSLRDRRPAEADPWGGFTLEWATSLAAAARTTSTARSRRSPPRRRCSTGASGRRSRRRGRERRRRGPTSCCGASCWRSSPSCTSRSTSAGCRSAWRSERRRRCSCSAGSWRARPREERVRLLPDNSYATVLVAVGVVMVGLGLLFGQWLYLIGAGVVVLGLGGIGRELLASRRSAG